LSGYVDLGGVAAGCLAVAALAGRVSRRGTQHDPQRAFTPAQRQQIFARAGGRCEHFGLLGFRCRRPAAHADHVIPWSRGGATTLANAQGLCVRHNLTKGARMPSKVTTVRLAHRRRRYFPPGMPTEIERSRR